MERSKFCAMLLSDLGKNAYEKTDNGGIYFPQHGIKPVGLYYDRVNDGEWNVTQNLITKEGMLFILNTALGSKSKASGFYIALFSGSTAPAANWTAANFASVANEITSLTEGYNSATRPQFIPTDASDETFIDNMGSEVELTIKTTSSLNVTGLALLTNANRGGTTGTLISATKYPVARTLQNDDVLKVGYRLALA